MDGGTAVDDEIVSYGGKPTTPADGVKDGYVFLGWYTDNTYSTEFDFTKPIYADTTVYASFRRPTVTLHYNNDGATEDSSAYYDYLNPVLLPQADTMSAQAVAASADELPVPVREGYRFDGWFKSEALAGSAVTKTPSEFEGDVDYYAAWTKIHTVSFVTNGADDIDLQSVIDGDKAVKPDDPERYNFTFEGWYTDSTFKKSYDFSKKVTSDLTLYAKWEIIPDPEPIDWSITVRKKQLLNGERIAFDADYYFALFSDAEGTVRVSDVMKASPSMDNYGKDTIVFEDVTAGTYYVFETDSTGAKATSSTPGFDIITIGGSNGAKVVLTEDQPAGRVIITNDYTTIVPGIQYTNVPEDADDDETEEWEIKEEEEEDDDDAAQPTPSASPTTAPSASPAPTSGPASPATGDTTHTSDFIIMLAVAAVLVVILVIIRVKWHKKRKIK